MIVIYGPSPQAVGVRNGWTRRIAAIDTLFADRERVYVWPERYAQRGDPLDYRIIERQVAPGVGFALLDLRFCSQNRRLRKLIADAEFVYAHTSHSAQHLLPYYGTGKIVTDLHGIAPEEELMQGHPNRSHFFAGLEAAMVRQSAALVVVTEAMMQHLRGKYAGLSTPHLVLPIVDDIAPRPRTPPGTRPRVIYSGGLQQWQNVDRMLSAVQQCGPRCEFRFLTENTEELRRLLAARGISDRVDVASMAPGQLAAAYADADFGFVLRDDSPVNRVSCPTKLSEYLACGVVPIVDLVAIGDFERHGYRYVTLADFLAGRLPAAAELQAWRQQNRQVYEAIRAAWRSGSEQLRQFRVGAPAGSDGRVAGMTSLELGSVYPLQGLQFAARRDHGTATVMLDDVVDAEVEVSIDLPGSGTLRGLSLQMRDLPMLISPAVVEIEDQAGQRHRVGLSAPRIDRFGNWVFEGPEDEAKAADLAIVEPRRLHCRFEILLVGPEVACVTGQVVVPPPPTLLQLLWRRFGRRSARC